MVVQPGSELRWFDVETLRRDPQVHENSRAYFDDAVLSTRIP